jgi:hypothetical protein
MGRPALTVALLAACLSVAAALWLTVFIDRTGGVTLILLRRSPAWPADSMGSEPAAVGWVLVRGNENGVLGEDLVRYNARYGVWAGLTLVAGSVALRARRGRD